MKRQNSLRLQGFDYSRAGIYFITICVNKDLFCFGRIRDRQMVLNRFGGIANEQWEYLEKKYAFLQLEEWVIMPDHVHALLKLSYSYKVNFESSRKSLSTLIGEFKASVSKEVRGSGYRTFQWQRSFHDRIIRNESEFWTIKNYIKENPARWTSP